MKTPQNPELEQAVLGSCLIDPDAIVKAMPIIAASDFYLERHAWIYAAMQSIQDRRDPLDFMTICAELEHHKKLEMIGGAAYLTALVNSQVTANNIENYATELASLSGKRKILHAATNIAEICYNGKDYDSAHAFALRELLKVAPKTATQFVSSETAIADLILRLRMRFDDPIDHAGLSTGYIDWDKKFGGLLPGLHVIEGRTSVGKTWLAIGIADGAAMQGINIAFISLEMSGEQIHLRRISRFSHIRQVSLRTGYVIDSTGKRKFNSTEVQNIETAARRVAELPIFISSDHFTTSSQVIAKLTQMKAEHNIGLAVVDYIQKFRDRAEREEKALGDAAHNLKDCADSLGIPLIALSQVNRSANQRDSRFLELGDTRGSGQIEEAADAMYAATSADYGKSFDPNHIRKNIVEIACLKDRLGGAAGRMIQLATIENTGSIENLAGAK